MPHALQNKLPGERDWIASIARRTRSSRNLRVGIGDDCAVFLVPAGHEALVTTDLLLETTHFRRDWHSPESAGHRCLARGLSDIAAMGAKPLAAFLSLAIPATLPSCWTHRFLDGLLQLAAEHGVPLAGGDTAQAPILGGEALFAADIMLVGSAPAGRALLRSGARPGDRIFVTGALGGAAAELLQLAAGTRRRGEPGPQHPQLFPQPRLAQGTRLRNLATAAIDLSDGLSTDLHHLCEASGVRARIAGGALPIHPLAARNGDALALALHGGEDYELLFTASPATRVPRSIAGVPVTEIGSVLRRRAGAPTVTITLGDSERPLQPGGWEHFRSAPATRPHKAKRGIV